jgi:hypothetical protein
MMDECLVQRWRVEDISPKEIMGLKHFNGSFPSKDNSIYVMTRMDHPVL